MSKSSFLSLVKKPGAVILSLADRGFFNWLSDVKFLKLAYFFFFGKRLNLENPKTFNEKLQWLKINNRNPQYPMMVDKYEVKKYISEIIGEEYLIPTLGLWNNVDDINLDSLPDQFVLKCTHDSGSVIICQNKNTLNVAEAKEKLRKHQNKNLFWYGREWPYKEVEPRIIAEKYLEDEDHQLMDYKIMCFNGEAKCCFVFSERFSDKGIRLNVYDRQWKLLPVGREYTLQNSKIRKPINYELMLELAERISEGIPFVRVDFYELKGKLYFGEITFYPNAGFAKFKPEKWDSIFGEWISLPVKH